MVLPEKLLYLYEQKLIGYYPSISNLTQYTLTHFFKEGLFYKHLNKMKVKYKQKRDELIKLLKQSTIGDDIIIKNADAGLHFILEHKKIKSEIIAQHARALLLDLKTIKEQAHLEHLEINNGLIIGYAHLKTEEMKQIVELLEKSISNSV
jgi:GntR family transcriptional regulator / MocR family aminotransferase